MLRIKRLLLVPVLAFTFAGCGGGGLAPTGGSSGPAPAPGPGTPPTPPTPPTSPTVSITNPTAGVVVSGTITVSAAAGGGSPIAGVQFLLNGVALGSEDTTAPYQISWNTGGASNGPHTLSARARTTAGTQMVSSPVQVTASNNAFLNDHRVVVDASSTLLSWHPQADAYSEMMRLAWEFIRDKRSRSNPPHYLRYCCFIPSDPSGGNFAWFHNPAGLYAMFVDSLIAYYPYSGDASLIPIVKEMLDYHLANGTTPGTWTWPRVPFASSRNGDAVYRGDGDGNLDGVNGIEPDKVGELGHAYLMFWELTGDTLYRDAALDAANALAAHVRTGNATQSPWPFRVDGQTGAVREEYSANAVAPVKLFDELIRLNLGDVAAYRSARDRAWSWVLSFPLQNNRWNAYFEDVGRDPGLSNLNQLVPMETARYILSQADPASVDPAWQSRVPQLLNWVRSTFGRGPYHGAWAIDEQSVCCSSNGLGSHTARWASINAMMFERTGNPAYREEAFRSFNYATYFSRGDGVVYDKFGSAAPWYTDGYGDYIKHFMAGIGAVPEWSPPDGSYLVRSSSVVRSITYLPASISYTTFDGQATDVLRLDPAFTPGSVTANGVTLVQRADRNGEGWMFDETTRVLWIRHDNATSIVVTCGNC